MSNRRSWLRIVLVFGLVAVATWLARYSESAHFGLYADDYTRVIHGMEADFGETVGEVWSCFRHPVGTQGRPLHPAAIFALSWAGEQLGGLHAVYLLGFVIVTANACLFFLLLRRMAVPNTVLAPAVVAYALFPADTSQAWLSIALGAQPSITAILLAFHFYLSRRFALAYLLSAFALGQYETVFPVFLAAPLLSGGWHHVRRQEWLRHLGTMAAMLAGVLAVRHFAGEHRVADLDLVTAVTWPLRQMAIGPPVAMATFLHRPVSSLRALPIELIPLLSTCFVAFAWLLYRIRDFAPGDPRAPHSRRLGGLALIGVVWLVLAYPFAFTLPAETITGRVSRVHLPAVLGASLLLGVTCSMALSLMNRIRLRLAAVALLAILFTGLVGFGDEVQRDYRLAWQYQRAFWSDVIRLCPDIKDDTVILFEEYQLRQPEHAEAFSWTVSLVPGLLYRFPTSTVPLAAPLRPDWRGILSRTDDMRQAMELDTAVVRNFNAIPSPEFILLEVEQGRQIRGGGPPVDPSSPLPARSLHGLLVMSPDEEPVDYLR